MNPNSEYPEGNAIVYCEGAFGTPNGKTAHGLVRFTDRYRVLSVIDSRHSGKEAGAVIDGVADHIPIFSDLTAAIAHAQKGSSPATHFVVGLAPDGGRLDAAHRTAVHNALSAGLHVDSGLHDFLSDDEEMTAVAREKRVRIRDIRKLPDRAALHFFSGKIEKVPALKIAVLGTDSAVGKRTTAWLLVHGLQKAGISAELIGTGQTAWLQGARYGVVMDSLVNDFVAGEIEHAVWSAWKDQSPDVLVIEGQGSLMNPAYPGGFEILAAGRPDIVILQHAPARKEYDGFPGYPIHPLTRQIEVVELLSGKPVVAVTVNHEGISLHRISAVCETIAQKAGRPALDVLKDGTTELMEIIRPYLKGKS